MNLSSGHLEISNFLSWLKGLQIVILFSALVAHADFGGARTRWSTFHNSFCEKRSDGSAIASKLISRTFLFFLSNILS